MTRNISKREKSIVSIMPQPPAKTPHTAPAAPFTYTPLRPPDDLLGALGTARKAMRYPPAVLPWWERLGQLPLGQHHCNPGPAPVLKAVRDGRSLVVWCRFCRKHHRHSAHTSLCDPADCACPLHTDRWAKFCLCPVGAPGSGGHRVAHCFRPGSPYRRTGYIIKEVAR